MGLAAYVGLVMTSNTPTMPATAMFDNAVVKDLDEKSEVRQADYYIAPTGDDANACSQERPCRTLSKVNSIVRPGDLVYIRGGTYKQPAILTKSGSNGNRITYEAYPGETPVFDGSSFRPGSKRALIELKAVDWITIQGIAFRNSPGFGIFMPHANDNVLEDILVTGYYIDGLKIVYGNRNVLKDMTARDSSVAFNSGNNSDGISIHSGANNQILRCNVFNNADDGVDIWGSMYTKIDRCVSRDNGRGSKGDGNGYKLGSRQEGRVGGHTVTNSIAAGNRSRGFDYNGSTIPIKMYNNTSFNNGSPNFHFRGPHILKNNLSYHGRLKLLGGVKDSHNSWNLDITNPRFASTDGNSSDFLELQSGSPAIDVGEDVDMPYSGAAPDLGARELTR